MRALGQRVRAMKYRHWLFAFCGAFALVAAGLQQGLAVGGGGGGASGGDVRSGASGGVYEDLGPGIRIVDAWVRESPLGSRTGGGYLKIVNNSPDADRLIGAESPIADKVVLKEMTFINGEPGIRTVSKGIEIPANAITYLRIESYYLQFEGLREPFAIDRWYAATLNFEKAGSVAVTFGVWPRMYWW
jgi:hypothetical protein